MNYAGEHVIAALKAARQAKGLSQRGLSTRSGVPQSQISKIENGAVDLQLSSLLELARVLDLELTLVPRKLVPAVEAIKRGGESASSPKAESTRRAATELGRIQDTVSRLSLPEGVEQVRRLQKAAENLRSFQINFKDLEKITKVAESIRRITETPQALHDIQRAAQNLQRIRNSLVHGISEPGPSPRPAYTLDEEDDDA